MSKGAPLNSSPQGIRGRRQNRTVDNLGALCNPCPVIKSTNSLMRPLWIVVSPRHAYNCLRHHTKYILLTRSAGGLFPRERRSNLLRWERRKRSCLLEESREHRRREWRPHANPHTQLLISQYQMTR